MPRRHAGLRCPYCDLPATVVSRGDHAVTFECPSHACAMDRWSLKLDMLLAQAEVAQGSVPALANGGPAPQRL